MLNTVPHQNVLLTDIVSNILDLDHLPIIFHILDHDKGRDFSNHTEKFTDGSSCKALLLN